LGLDLACPAPRRVKGSGYWAHSEETTGGVTVLESLVAPGEGPPLHVHVNEDEFIYVLEGRLRVRLEKVVVLSHARAGERQHTAA